MRGIRVVYRPQEPIFWLFAVLTLIGVVRMSTVIAQGVDRYPTGTWLAMVVFAVYTVPFARFINRRDLFAPEPPALLVIAFVWGAAVATTGALAGNMAIFSLNSKLGGLEFAANWNAAIAGPTTEELLKTAGIVAIVLLARGAVGSTLDGMVYGAMIGLGFQVVENVIYCINAIELNRGESEVIPVVQMLIMRGFVSGLWSHATYSAIIGAGVGFAVSSRQRSRSVRISFAVVAFVLGWGIHFLWNSPLLTTAFGDGAGILLAILVKGLLGLSILIVLYRLARGADRRWFVSVLQPEVDRGVMLP